MDQPQASRPYMPGYGTLGPSDGSGLLPWSWAEERLEASHDYWVATVRPDGHPHVMPVWGAWHEGAVWFSSSGRSRKTRNLESDPRCAVTTDNAQEPVVVQGTAARVTDLAGLRRLADPLDLRMIAGRGRSSSSAIRAGSGRPAPLRRRPGRDSHRGGR